MSIHTEEDISTLYIKNLFIKLEEVKKQIESTMLIHPKSDKIKNTYKAITYWLNRKDKFMTNALGTKMKFQMIMKDLKKFKTLYTPDNSDPKILSFLNKMVTFALSSWIEEIYRKSPGGNFALQNLNLESLRELATFLMEEKEYSNAYNILSLIINTHHKSKRDPFILSLMGECLIQLGKEKEGILLLQKAFLIDPQNIDISFINYNKIKKLINDIKEEKGIKNIKELKEWIPVYGYIKGIFPFHEQKTHNEVVEIINEIKKDYHTIKRNQAQETFSIKLLIPKTIKNILRILNEKIMEKERDKLILLIKDLSEDIYEEMFRIGLISELISEF